MTMSKNKLAFAIATAGIAFWAAMLAVGAEGLPQLTRHEIPGVRNMTQVDAAIACAGATDAAAIPAIAQRGVKTIINLRVASERDANVDAAREAAARAGIRYIHLPFDAASPDSAVVDRFLAAVSDSANHPLFVHDSSASRAAALLMIKRVAVDGWDAARAETEARTIGLSSPALRDWALSEIAKRKR
jgi:uncharacterized protein (TIGR01244 family)